jgi:hypothetical protein
VVVEDVYVGEGDSFHLEMPRGRAISLLRRLRRAVPNPNSAEAVEETARRRADEGREDRAAVDELLRVAEGSRGALELALLGLRDHELHRIDRVTNRASRLVEAALADSEVPPVSHEDARSLAEVDAFEAEAPHERWQRLVGLHPELADFETQARHGAFGDVRRIRASRLGRIRPHECADMDQRMRMHLKVGEIIGPDSAAEDAVSRSPRALSSATDYLEDLSDHYWAIANP